MFTAHIGEKGRQSLKDHSLKSAEIAKNDLSAVGLGDTAYIAALLHDSGKANNAFLKYIEDSSAGKPTKKGSVIHTFASAYFLLKNYHETNNGIRKITSELLAYAAAAHHGLFDVESPDNGNGFDRRITKQPKEDEISIKNFFDEATDIKTVNGLFESSTEEIKVKLQIIAQTVCNAAMTE